MPGSLSEIKERAYIPIRFHATQNSPSPRVPGQLPGQNPIFEHEQFTRRVDFPLVGAWPGIHFLSLGS